MHLTTEEKQWADQVIRNDEITRYLNNGKDFVDEELIWSSLEKAQNPSKSQIRDIIQKSLGLNRLDPIETAALLHCTDEDLWQEMYAAGLKIKQTVYGRRIVVFAPLYVSDYCVNNCVYCGFRSSNEEVRRKQLSQEELRGEIRALANAGHKRLIMVYGEHPSSDANYIKKTIETAYSVKEKNGEIRRVNVNAAPMSIADLKELHKVGIGTYQVFQETYHHETYKRLHPQNTLKGNYLWRLYALHRAQEAQVDDVAIGALFGLYDYRFEVLALLLHAIDLEQKFDGVGPHTISFPRLEPAVNTPYIEKSQYKIDDATFKKIVTVLRLSVPYTGMILTARESPEVRRDVIPVGITQIDAGSNISIGGYSEQMKQKERQQFELNDNRSLDEVMRELAEMGMITSFCTAGYRCGRTGHYFMDIAKKGKVHHMCMPNAILTFKEYLEDYASEATKAAGNGLIQKEIEALPTEELRLRVKELVQQIETGKRDLYL